MTTGAGGGVAPMSVALRNGGALTLWPDRLEVAGSSYALAEIAWVGLVNDPSAPAGAQPLPALAWRTAAGQHASATPADPPQTWQALEAIFAQRPDLRMPLPPPPPPPQPGYPPASGGYGPYGAPAGYMPYGYETAPQQGDNQTVMAGLAHLSIFFGALIVPLILWLVNRGKAAYAAQQSKQAFFFHVAVAVIEIVIVSAGVLLFVASGFAMASNPRYGEGPPALFIVGTVLWYVAIFGVQITAIVLGIIAAVKAFQGKSYHYPLMGRV